MKRVVAVASAVLAVGAFAVPASAATKPTLAAPASATYYSTVTLTGSAPEPGEAVDVLFRAAGTKNYIARRHLTANAAGQWSTTYTALSTQYVAARADGVNSAVHVVRVPTAHCTVSAPAFTQLPGTGKGDTSRNDSAELTTVRGSTWAGYSDLPGGTQGLFTWHGGTPHLVARYTYRDTQYVPGISVAPVGLTPGLALVANVQDPAIKLPPSSTRPLPLRVYYWYRGVRHTMSHGSWSAWAATGVSDSGRVVGWAATGTYPRQRYSVVTWPHAGDRYQVVAAVGGAQPTPVIDARGDLAWSDDAGRATLRTVEGATHPLLARPYPGGEWSAGSLEVEGASSNAIYATGQSGLLRWYVHPESASGTVMHGVAIAGPSADIVDAVGRQNSVSVGYTSSHLRTAAGAYTAVPSQWLGGGPAVSAIDAHGTLAFTAKSDRRVHFLSCR